MSRALGIGTRSILTALAAIVLAGAAGKANDVTPARSAPAKPQGAQKVAPVPAGDADKTLSALHDELERSRTRLMLPGQETPYYIQYRLLNGRGRHRSRLRFAAPGPVASHRSGVQRSSRLDLEKARVSAQPRERAD